MRNEAEGLFGLAGRRLLVVEDNGPCAEAVRMWLEICGAKVDVAPSVDAALRRLRARVPDVVLADVFLPDGTAWDLVARLRRQVPGGRRVPVVAITGAAQGTIVRAADRHGVRHLITKPIEPEALAAALTDCLDRAA
jgi:CheY-like chemotaxis protein